MNPKLEAAKKVLEEILNREKEFSKDAYEESITHRQNEDFPDENYSRESILEIMHSFGDTFYYFRKNIPEIISKGTYQIVLHLTDDYIGKTRPRTELRQHYELSDIFVYEAALRNSVRLLTDLGFTVAEHNFFWVRKKNDKFFLEEDGPSFVLAENLTKGGKYLIEDIKKKHFEELDNGLELKQELDEAIQLFKDIKDEKKPPYGLRVNGHVGKKSPEKAFRHLFFNQINPETNKGELIIGDIEHVCFYKYDE